MRVFLKQACVFAFVVAVSCRVAVAARMDFFLTVNDVTNTWELAVSTDSLGGIGAIAVNLSNINSAVNVAPRSAFQGAPIHGFIHGYFDLPKTEYPVDHPNRWQAFAAQLPLDTSTIVYGVGYVPVPDSLFGVQSPVIMVGSAMSVPTVFYTGTYEPADGTPNYHPDQNKVFGSVWTAPPPPGGYDPSVLPKDISLDVQTVSYNKLVVPEPAACLLALIGIPVLFFKRQCVHNTSPPRDTMKTTRI